MPMIIIQTPQPRYRPPQNPPGYLQIMQAIDITDDQVGIMMTMIIIIMWGIPFLSFSPFLWNDIQNVRGSPCFQ